MYFYFCWAVQLLDRDANYISKKEVWQKISREAPKHGLEPTFVYAICHAESSLNANAESSVAKGMMQLTEAAWSDVTKLHYRQAFEWETNVEIGMLYLQRLKGYAGKSGSVLISSIGCELSLRVWCTTKGEVYGEPVKNAYQSNLSKIVCW